MLAYILLFIITLVVAYIMGLTLVNVVDKRLSNISINVPKQNVTVTMDPFTNTSQNTDSTPTVETFTPTQFADIQQEVKDYKTPPLNGVDQFRDYKLRPDLFNSSLPQTDVCCINHIHKGCTYGPTNYPAPSDMTAMERRTYANNYPQNMTIQDYVNWLWTNKRSRTLHKEHMENLDILRSGKPLKRIPGKIPPPPRATEPSTASEHFANLYKGGFDFKNTMTFTPPNDEPLTETMAASNYEDYETQSCADSPGTPYQGCIKKDAKALDKLTRPQLKPERYVHISEA